MSEGFIYNASIWSHFMLTENKAIWIWIWIWIRTRIRICIYGVMHQVGQVFRPGHGSTGSQSNGFAIGKHLSFYFHYMISQMVYNTDLEHKSTDLVDYPYPRLPTLDLSPRLSVNFRYGYRNKYSSMLVSYFGVYFIPTLGEYRIVSDLKWTRVCCRTCSGRAFLCSFHNRRTWNGQGNVQCACTWKTLFARARRVGYLF